MEDLNYDYSCTRCHNTFFVEEEIGEDDIPLCTPCWLKTVNSKSSTEYFNSIKPL